MIGPITPTEIVPTTTPITSFRITRRRSAFVGFGSTTAISTLRELDSAGAAGITPCACRVDLHRRYRGSVATDCGGPMAQRGRIPAVDLRSARRPVGPAGPHEACR